MKGRAFVLTAEQTAWLRANAATLDYDDMAAHLGCGIRTVGKVLKPLGLTGLKAHPWTAEDEQCLRAMAGKYPIHKITHKLRRDWQTVTKHAQALGIALDFDRWWPPEKVQRLRDLAAAGCPRRQIAAEMGERYRNILNAAQRFNVPVVLERSFRAAGDAMRKAPRRERAPRERVGLPVAIRRNVVQGSVRYCSDCSAPVVDTPERWAEHNLRVHTAPIRRIA